MREVNSEHDELGALIVDIYAVVHEINRDKLAERGEVAATELLPIDMSSPSLKRYPNHPTRDMVATATAYVLIHHVLPAEDGPLAPMGERARRYEDTFRMLGEERLAELLLFQVGRIVTGFAGEELFGPTKGSARTEAMQLDAYRRRGLNNRIRWHNLVNHVLPAERALHGTLAHIVFGGIRGRTKPIRYV